MMNLASSDQQTFDCPMADFFCPPNLESEIVDQEATERSLTINECYNCCYSRKDDPTDPCLGFTLLNIRYPICYLLKEGCDINTYDECFKV